MHHADIVAIEDRAWNELATIEDATRIAARIEARDDDLWNLIRILGLIGRHQPELGVTSQFHEPLERLLREYEHRAIALAERIKATPEADWQGTWFADHGHAMTVIEQTMMVLISWDGAAAHIDRIRRYACGAAWDLYDDNRNFPIIAAGNYLVDHTDPTLLRCLLEMLESDDADCIENFGSTAWEAVGTAMGLTLEHIHPGGAGFTPLGDVDDDVVARAWARVRSEEAGDDNEPDSTA